MSHAALLGTTNEYEQRYTARKLLKKEDGLKRVMRQLFGVMKTYVLAILMVT